MTAADPGRGASPAWDLALAGRVKTGTCSWTDRTMTAAGVYYPKEARTPEDRLRFYAQDFPIVEVDATYYALPSEANARAWVERTPGDFTFNVKAFSMLTGHPTKVAALPPQLREALPPEEAGKKNVYPDRLPPDMVDEVWDRFCLALRPLGNAGKLGCILFQFPEWFPPGRASRDHILDCAEKLDRLLPGIPCAVEFRNESWMRDDRSQERTLAFLTQHRLPYVCVDMPQGFRSSVPPAVAATAPLAMVRFHGRKSDTWDRKGILPSERFRWDYSEQELSEWGPGVSQLREQAQEVHLMMNNCYRDYAVRSARKVAQLTLETQGMPGTR
ncbi:MAG TPA: DUF72 domain-containing protein [Actinomycetota bacterium]|nr:DUF72 domain-containing protein [Actinomycetota bacterium]